MQKQKQTSIAKKRGLYIALALMLFVGAPVLGAILVQNFTQWDVEVAAPPIAKVQGADADYDGDGDDTTGYLQVDLGQTISNDDSGLYGGTDTNLAHEEITFTCFQGDRTYYTDVIQLQNTTALESWDVTLTVEDDLAGNPDVEDTFTTGNADIWMFASAGNTAVTPVSAVPNPSNLPAAWDTDSIQLEVIGGVLSAFDNTAGSFTLAPGEQRQLALVVDCDAAMDTAQTGTFRLTVASSPN